MNVLVGLLGECLFVNATLCFSSVRSHRAGFDGVGAVSYCSSSV